MGRFIHSVHLSIHSLVCSVRKTNWEPAKQAAGKPVGMLQQQPRRQTGRVCARTEGRACRVRAGGGVGDVCTVCRNRGFLSFVWGKGGTGVHSPMSGRQEGEGWGRGQRMAETMGPGAWAQLGGAGQEACVRLEEA